MRKRLRVWAAVGVVVGLLLAIGGAEPALAKKKKKKDKDKSGIVAKAVVTDLAFPSMFTVAGDGRIFYSELKSGVIGVYDPATKKKSTFATVADICQDGSAGLGGLALHPTDANTLFAYVGRQVGAACQNQLLRVTSGVVSAPLWTSSPAGSHNGGRLKFGPDGKLYVSVGESDLPATAQDPGDDKGKMLRFEASGDRISGFFASGLRNVFGFDFDPTGGRLWATDNGSDCNEEVNLIVSGGNYGWGPSAVCTTPPPAPQNTNQDGALPILPAWYNAAQQGATGGAFCSGCGLGAAIEGRFLMFLYDIKQLQALTLSADRLSVTASKAVFTHARSSKPLSLERGPDGRLYMSDEGAIYVLQAK